MPEPVDRERPSDFGPNDAGNAHPNATLIPFLSPVSGRVGDAGDSDDWYRFVAPVFGAVTFRLTGLAADLDLYVHSSTQQLLGSSGAAATSNEVVEDVVVLGGSTYYVHVDPYLLAASDYQLSFSFFTLPDDGGESFATAVPLALNDEVVSSVGYGADVVDVFRVTAPAIGRLTAELLPYN